jgi:hypothetical protein
MLFGQKAWDGECNSRGRRGERWRTSNNMMENVFSQKNGVWLEFFNYSVWA